MFFGGPASCYGSPVPWLLPFGMAVGIQTSLCIMHLKWSSNPCCPSLPTKGAERWVRDNSAFHSVSDSQLAFSDFLLPPTTQVWKSLSCFWLFVTLWTVACQAPLSMEFSRQKLLGVGCHALLQGVFPTQGSNPGLPHCRRILYRLSHQESPNYTSLLFFSWLISLMYLHSLVVSD